LESKLTLLLKGALGGSSRTYTFVTGSMHDMHADQTVDALRFGEHCSNITNQASQIASSREEAVAAIDKALTQCRSDLASLESRGKQSLPAFKMLQAKCAMLARKRDDLAQQVQAASA